MSWGCFCDLCGRLGPYGFFRRRADGSWGYAWSCPDHVEAVKALPGVEPQPSASPAVAARPAVPAMETPRTTDGQGRLL